MSGAKNILIIGETGVGKSSLVNLVIGRNVAPVSRAASRVTFSVTRYPYKNFVLVDTVGFNDAVESNPTEALMNLAKFVTEVNKDGISLIIYVMRKGRITKASKTNYEYFVKTVCDNQVPVLLVVTHCESELTQQNWYLQEKKNFEDFGMTFAGIECGCAIDPEDSSVDPDLLPLYKIKRHQTQRAVRDKLDELALTESWNPGSQAGWYGKVFHGGLKYFGLAVSTFVAILPSFMKILEPVVAQAVKEAVQETQQSTTAQKQ